MGETKLCILKRSEFILRILRDWRIRTSFEFSQLIVACHERFLQSFLQIIIVVMMSFEALGWVW